MVQQFQFIMRIELLKSNNEEVLKRIDDVYKSYSEEMSEYDIESQNLIFQHSKQ